MPRQVRKQPETTEKKPEETIDAPVKTEHKSPEELKADMDALLDDIEEVLAENATEFVNSYIQKGGQ